MAQQICILGATGSIGTQTLDVIRQHPEQYEAYCLTAHSSVTKLAEQAREFRPACVVIADESRYDELKVALSDCPEIAVYAGKDALDQVVEADPVDAVVTAMVGFAGLSPTLHAISAGKKICLANKETLVVAGELITERLQASKRSCVLPVDSEHSAIFQSLVGESCEIEKILLTASGGPFRNYSREQMASVTAADALRHPTWDMGAKITIDSATMMNKGFEVIEAKWLFGVQAEQIEVLVHPQSIVHSAVQFVDGSVKAQLGVPDMRLPIQYAMSYPERLPLNSQRLNLFERPLEFFKPDMEKFPCLALAYDSLRRGGNSACAMNAANEVVNLAFRENRCGYLAMAEVIADVMARTPFIAKPTLDDLFATDAEARRLASEAIKH